MSYLRFILFMIIVEFTVFYSKGYPQEGFEYIINTNGKAYCNDSKKDNENNIIIVANQLTPIEHQYDISIIIRVSQGGDTLIKILDRADTLIYLHEVEVTNSNEYLFFGSIGIADTFNNLKKMDHIWILKMDSSFNIISDKRYKLAWDYWNPFYFTSISDQDYIYAGGYCHYYNNNGDYKHMFMAIFDSDGDTVCTNYPDLGNLNIGSHTFESILELNFGYPGITLFGDGFINNSQGQIIEIDSLLNYTVTEAGFPDGYSYWWSSLKHLDPNHYLFATAANPYNKDLEDDVMVMKMDQNHECENFIILNRPDTNDYPAWRRAIDFVYKDKIYVSGHQEHFIADPVNANIFVYLIDSALNIRGLKYYGGEKNYSILTITATSDGGCVLGGSVYDWQNSPPDIVDLWIRKILPDEIITHAEDTPSPDDFDVALFPNPFSDYFYISSLRDDLELSLTDVTGKEICREKIKGALNQQIEASGFSKGQYFYKIYSGKKTIQNGRMIKI